MKNQKGKEMRNNAEYRSRFRILKGGKISLVISVLFGTLAFGAPSGGSVSSGSASISSNGTTTTITQSTDKASINWQSFSIASNETVNFVQPSSSSVTLNRVIGNDASIIAGHLNANGQVFLLNPNGVIFTKGSQVNVGALVASTLNMSDTDFNSGNYVLSGTSSTSVLNQGDITTANGGYVVFAAKSVTNEGTITSQEGNVQLASGEQISLNINGNSLVSLNIDKGTYDALVSNKGIIEANGGAVYLTSKAMDSVLSGVVNNSGIIQAHGISTKEGKVVLFAHGGTLQAGGTLDTGSGSGFIETSGEVFTSDDTLHVTTGEWLIDPVDLTIDSTLASTISTTLNGGADVTESATNDITVASAITWNTAKKLTLSAGSNIYINAAITASNAAGQVELDYGQSAVASGNSSSYDFGLTSSGFTGSINLQAGNNFFTKLGSDGATTTYTVITSLGSAGSTTGTDLQGMNGNLSGNYVLGTNIDATATSTWNSGAGWDTIGHAASSTYFTGKFDGLGHTVNNITVNDSTGAQVGFFGYIQNATVQNVGITNVNIHATTGAGGLVGRAMADSGGTTLIANDYVTGTVSTTSAIAGGLIGVSFTNAATTTITNSYSTANISGTDYLGGFMGEQIKDLQTGSSTISYSYATGTVTGSGSYVGGFLGHNETDYSTDTAAIQNCYATGDVTGVDSVGGLVGENYAYSGTSSITNSYSTGKVTGSTNVGGLVGYNWTDNGGTPSVTNSFWDTTTSTQANGIGTNTGGTVTSLQGLTTAQMQFGQYYSDAGWSISMNSALSSGTPTFSSGAWQIGPLSLSYNLGNKSSTYNGADQSLSSFYTSASNIFGSNYSFLDGKYHFTNGGSTITSYKNAGTYSNIKVASDSSYLAIASSGNTDGTLTINKAPLTITAQTNTKTYDSTTTASATPTVSGLLGSDTVTGLTESYDNKNVGTAKTLSVSGYTINDGNSGNNYAVTTNTDTSGVINQAVLTITAQANTKTYDGTTTASATPTVSGLLGSDTVTGLTESYDNKNVGTAKTLSVNNGYTINDGNFGNNYAITVNSNNNGVINEAHANDSSYLQIQQLLAGLNDQQDTQTGNDGLEKKDVLLTPPSEILGSTPFEYFYLGNILVQNYMPLSSNLQLKKKNGHFVIAQK